MEKKRLVGVIVLGILLILTLYYMLPRLIQRGDGGGLRVIEETIDDSK